MSTAPTWGPIASDTADLLDLLAETNPATPSEADEWEFFLSVLEDVANADVGRIDQNRTRSKLHGHVKPNRIGAYFHRAVRQGLIRSDGWTVTADSQSGNGGKPARAYVWLYSDLPAAPSPGDRSAPQGGERHAR